MIKRYCDCCGNEILSGNNANDLNPELKLTDNETVSIHIQTVQGKDICKHCVIDAFNRCDNRQVVAKAALPKFLTDNKQFIANSIRAKSILQFLTTLHPSWTTAWHIQSAIQSGHPKNTGSFAQILRKMANRGLIEVKHDRHIHEYRIKKEL